MMCTNVERGISLSSASSALKPYADCQVGEHFFYGSYPQGKSVVNLEVKPIEWRVLARESDRVLVIAEHALDCKEYNLVYKDINWSQCTLRSWLNYWFVKVAFSDMERENLLEVTLPNPNSPEDWNNVPGGPDTLDRVFLLSMDEAKRYFSGGADLYCQPTAYAHSEGAWISPYKDATAGNCCWWLRSPGLYASFAVYIDRDGRFLRERVNNDYYAVRPAAFMAL